MTAPPMGEQPRFTTLGKLISILLVSGLIALGVYLVVGDQLFGPSTPTDAPPAAEAEGGEPAVSEVQVEVPKLSPPAAFQYKDNIVPIEISEYAGYAGLIAANGGLDPSEGSDRKSTRLNSSHLVISYAVFCLKQKKHSCN